MTTSNEIDAWMWAQACEMLGRAERMHRQFFQPATSTQAAWEPPVDVIEGPSEFVIVVAMPGVSSGSVQVSQEPGALRVHGVRALPLSASAHHVRQLEIPHGVFERRIALPPGRYEMAPPDMRDGCLVLRLLKKG